MLVQTFASTALPESSAILSASCSSNPPWIACQAPPGSPASFAARPARVARNCPRLARVARLCNFGTVFRPCPRQVVRRASASAPPGQGRPPDPGQPRQGRPSCFFRGVSGTAARPCCRVICQAPLRSPRPLPRQNSSVLPAKSTFASLIRASPARVVRQALLGVVPDASLTGSSAKPILKYVSSCL